ncbi:MAG: nitroreductase family deazaflavin-dependent oxidoreductase [Acidimicrobiia bacterium]|nr:nitroreductase family deazaflavin-dependent oxidoreductase [Acidimicrobiia bacterium]
MLGNRFIIIEHEGRKSGRPYRTAVEVVAHDPTAGSWTVAAAWGERPDWFANLEHRDARAVVVAGHRYESPGQQRLDPTTACDVLTAYVCAHPLAARVLFRVLRWPDPRRPGALRQVTSHLPMLTFTASRPGGEQPV